MSGVRYPVLVAMVSAAMTVATLAQTSRPASQETGYAGLLAGPKVPDDLGPPVSFGGASPGRREITVPPRRWITVLQDLDLSVEQQAEVQRIWREFQQTRRAHQQVHGKEIKALRERYRQERRPEVQQELIRLVALGPQPVDYQQRIWDLLDDGQQDRMCVRLTQIRRAIARRRADERGA